MNEFEKGKIQSLLSALNQFAEHGLEGNQKEFLVDCIKEMKTLIAPQEVLLSIQPSAENNIFAIFDKAKEKMKYPKLKIIRTKDVLNRDPEDGTDYPRLIFALAGNKSKVPGSISVTDSGKYPGNKFYARITRGANNQPLIKWYNDASTDHYVKSEIETILGDPIGFGKLHGIKFSNCMFCGLELTNKNSVTVGYGPICAENWGLPWEGMADKSEYEREREREEILKNL